MLVDFRVAQIAIKSSKDKVKIKLVIWKKSYNRNNGRYINDHSFKCRTK